MNRKSKSLALFDAVASNGSFSDNMLVKACRQT